MRWDDLFSDLEALVEEEDRAALDAEVADLARAERAALTLADRLRGHVGAAVRLTLVDGEPVEGRVDEVGATWVSLAGSGDLLVPLGAVTAVAGLGAAASPQEPGLVRRLPFSVVLRGLSRDRRPVSVRLVGGTRLDGTIDRVGADHLDLAEHPADEPRRAAAVRGTVTLRTEAVLVVRVRP